MKIDLGTKPGETMAKAADKPYYPTITIRKKLSKSYKPGDKISGKFEGVTREIRLMEDGEHECVVELHSVDMGGGKADTSKNGAEAFDSMMKEESGKRAEKKKNKPEDNSGDDDDDY